MIVPSPTKGVMHTIIKGVMLNWHCDWSRNSESGKNSFVITLPNSVKTTRMLSIVDVKICGLLFTHDGPAYQQMKTTHFRPESEMIHKSNSRVKFEKANRANGSSHISSNFGFDTMFLKLM